MAKRGTHSLETAEGGTCQDMDRQWPGGELTLWRQQREEFVRTQKEPNRPKCTHFLETAEGLGQDMERNWPAKAHSHTGDGRGRDLSGHGKKLTGQGTLTFWRQQREGLVRTQKEPNRPRCTHVLGLETAEGLVRTWKETDRQKHTHILETAEGGTCQDMERNRLTEAHSLPGDSRGRDLSGHGKKPTD